MNKKTEKIIKALAIYTVVFFCLAAYIIQGEAIGMFARAFIVFLWAMFGALVWLGIDINEV